MRRQLPIALAAMVLAAPCAHAHGRDSTALNCPSTAHENRIHAIQERINALQARFEALDSRLEDFNSYRRDALDQAKARIEEVARNPLLSPAEARKQVDRALAQADAKAKSVTRSASAAHSEMTSLKGKMQSLEQQLHTLASRSVFSEDKDDL